MPTANIIDVFIEAAEKFPERTVLAQDSTAITYGRLLSEVRQTAAGLSAKGIRKGDAVLVFVPMSPDLYRNVLALFYLGAVPVFLDEWVSMARLKACVELVPCKALIAPWTLRLIAYFIPVLRKIPVKCGPDVSSSSQDPDPAVAVAATDTALITFTTGSTGVPKAADRTHGFLHAQLTALRPLLEDGLQRTLTLLPIVVLLNMALGKSTVLPPRKFKAKKPATYPALAEAFRQHQPGSAIVSPAIAERLLERGTPADFASLRQVLTGGGPVFPGLARKFSEVLPKAGVLAVFGSTEAEPIAHLDAAELADIEAGLVLSNGLPVGRVDPHANVIILPWVDEPLTASSDADLVSLAMQDGIGEIVVSGEHVLAHYIRNPAAEHRHKIRTAERVWHRTGDCGRLDGEGRLFLYGRCSEVIVVEGKEVYPMLAEYFLQVSTGCGAMALLQNGTNLRLVLEENDYPRREMLKELAATIGLSEVQIVALPFIPKDPRHQTKIDRERLRFMLKLR